MRQRLRFHKSLFRKVEKWTGFVDNGPFAGQEECDTIGVAWQKSIAKATEPRRATGRKRERKGHHGVSGRHVKRRPNSDSWR